MLIIYFQDREIEVKWHGLVSNTKKIPGGGAMGIRNSSLKQMKMTVSHKMTDLKLWTILVHWKSSTSLQLDFPHLIPKNQVPSDIQTHGQYINPENLKSQEYLMTGLI